MFGLSILPEASREEALTQRRRARYQQAGQQAEETYAGARPGHRAAQRAFAEVGTGMASLLSNTKFGQEKLGLRPEGMSPDQERMFDIQEAGQADYKANMEARTDEEQAGMSAIDKRLALMDSMARSAAEAGDMGTYAKLLDGMYQTSMEDKLNQAKLAELNDQQYGGQTWNFERMRKMWPSKDRSEFRETFAATEANVRHIGQVVDLIDEVTTEVTDADGNVIRRAQESDVLTKHPGGVISFMSGLRNLFNTAVSEVGSAYGDSSREAAVKNAQTRWNDRTLQEGALDPDATSGIEGDITKNGEVLSLVDRFVPESITGANERARYKAIVIQMAYAQWRMNEGSGSRQASNQDIAMALDQLGANGTSMDMVLQTMLQNSMAGLQGLENKINQNVNAGEAIGLTRDFVTTTLFGGDLSELYTDMNGLLGRAQGYMSGQRAPLPGEGAVGDAITQGATEEPVPLDDLISTWLD